MSLAKSESDLHFWYLERDARLGISAVGFEGGGGPAIWDDARIARAHGLAIDEESGAVSVLDSGRTSPRHRANVVRSERIGRSLALLPPETRRLLRAAFASCASWYRVASHFNSERLAPLVGLALVVWYEERPDDPRPPAALLESWDNALATNGPQMRKVLDPLKAKTLALYGECVSVFDACAAHVAKEWKAAESEADYDARVLREVALRRRRRS